LAAAISTYGNILRQYRLKPVDQGLNLSTFNTSDRCKLKQWAMLQCIIAIAVNCFDEWEALDACMRYTKEQQSKLKFSPIRPSRALADHSKGRARKK